MKISLSVFERSIMFGLLTVLFLAPVSPPVFNFSQSAAKPQANASPNSPPTASVNLTPDPAYAGSPLRGSASFMDSGGNFEGNSTFRWLVNGSLLASGSVAQTFLLPLDGSLTSTDGRVPTVSSNLSFVPGHFGQAVHFNPAAKSRLAYSTAGAVDTAEGSIEMWVQLPQALSALGFGNVHPRLFSVISDSADQLYVEINTGRILIISRKQGTFSGTWPDPLAWHAGEWHQVTATWSASSHRQAVYADCVLVGEAPYQPLTGSASQFFLGSADPVESLDGNLDDVRVSRRTLSAAEIGASCTRNAPALNDEVLLLADQFKLGDQITFELTPCSAAGLCGTPTRKTTTVVNPPLSALQPLPGILPEGTTALTLSLSTTAPADCRWASQTQTTYPAMPNAFMNGQGTTSHQTSVNGLVDLANRWFYVRCLDVSPGRDPDAFERSTHIRILGPLAPNFPQLSNLWGTYDPALGLSFYAANDLIAPASWNHQGNQADQIRALNPRAKILLTENASYGWPSLDPLTAEWWNSQPGDPGYICLLRDPQRNIIKTSDADHPMYNLTVPYCRNALVQQDISIFLSPRPDQGDNLAYDGIYMDRLYTTISWLSSHIDLNLDGVAENRASADQAYQAGIEDFLTQLRAALPYVILVGNEAPQELSPWLNGRVFEWQMASLLDGTKPDLGWNEVLSDYQGWAGLGAMPHTDLMMSSPERFYQEKYTQFSQVPPAVMEEAQSSYQRMRFGLATALMGNGLFAYDYGPYGHGTPWWYDEFGFLPGISTSIALPPPGYLGQPLSAASLLIDHLTTPSLLSNGDFQNALVPWSLWVNTAAGASAALTTDASGGANGSAAAHVVITAAAATASVEFRQSAISILSGQSYTLSFWARSSVLRTILIDLKKNPAGVNYGFNTIRVTLTPQWQQFHIAGVATATAADGKLEFLMGDQPGDVWLDNIALQAGALGVWSRPFQNGLAVVNTTHEVQTATLPGTYCKLDGNQAPLFETRVDESAASASAGWNTLAANLNQFGASVYTAAGGSGATITYAPSLAYGGKYALLAWVAPAVGQSSAVSVLVHAASGDVSVTLNEAAGAVGWSNLGTFTFDAGAKGYARLTATGSGVVVADAFKWVSLARYNDGSPTTHVTLQPQDGIILLSACLGVQKSSFFLPLVK